MVIERRLGCMSLDDCLALLRGTVAHVPSGTLSFTFSGGRVLKVDARLKASVDSPPPEGGPSESAPDASEGMPSDKVAVDAPNALSVEDEPLPTPTDSLARTSTWRLGGCRRCGGDLRFDAQEQGHVCLQCGAAA